MEFAVPNSRLFCAPPDQCQNVISSSNVDHGGVAPAKKTRKYRAPRCLRYPARVHVCLRNSEPITQSTPSNCAGLNRGMENTGALPVVGMNSVSGNSTGNIQIPKIPTAVTNSLSVESNGGTEDGIVSSVTDVQQQMVALQQAFQQKQADLLFHFQQSQAQLALQHYQLSQQLLRDAARRRQEQEAVTAAGRELQRFASGPLAEQNRGHVDEIQLNNGPNLIGVSASEYDLSRSAAGGSGAISLQTREKLKAHLVNKRLRRRATQAGSPHYEPYPIPNNCMMDGVTSPTEASNDDYDLRKTRSEPNLKMMPPRGALHHHHNPGSLWSKLYKQQSQHDHGPLSNIDEGAVENQEKVTTFSQQAAAELVVQQQQQQQQQAAAAAAAALSALFSTPSLPNISAYQSRQSAAILSAALPIEPLSSAVGGQLFFSVPSMLPYLSAAALQQAAAAASVASTNSMASQWSQQAESRPLFDTAGGGGLVEGNRRTPTVTFAGGHRGQIGHANNAGSHGLLKQQLRDLLLRRRSLVPEETADELKHETVSSSPTFSSGGFSGGKNAAATGWQETGVIQCSPKGTGLAYDTLMCKHQCICGDNSQHVEHGGRVQSIWARLQETGLVDECEKIAGRKAPIDYLRLCHGDSYSTFFAVSPSACLRFESSELPLKEFVQLPCGGIGVDSDTYFNDAFTPAAARLAAGCCVELCAAVAEGRLKNGFAIVRPPGHHAEPEQALGFCFFNNVAIAAQVLRKKYNVEKVAIVDWDVHHGNGTQLIFEKDPDVLYLSLHRHDDGNFFPGTGAIADVGVNTGRGASVNVAWSGEMMGDPEYLAAWRIVTLPILDRFQPDFILVSAGFDAANGHRNALGGYKLSAALFGYFTKSLVSRYAGGKIVLILEGGYDLAVISDAAEQCVRALKEASTGQTWTMKELSQDAVTTRPNASAQSTLARVVQVQREFWPALTADGVGLSHSEWLTNLPRRFANLTMTAAVSVDDKEGSEERIQVDDDDDEDVLDVSAD